MSTPSRRPNILLVTSDQHRADALGSAGHRCVRTPHLDLLAQQGIAFERAYTDCPICIPSRTTLITGIQAHHNGMPAYAADFRVNRPREAFLGSLVTRAGYQTQLIGKTHWHTEVGFRAGFEAVTFLAQLRLSQAAHYGRPGDVHGMGVNEFGPVAADLPPHLQSSRWIVERCLDFLSLRDTSQPFFLWASFQDPHPPMSVQEPYASMYRGRSLPEAHIPAWCTGVSGPRALFLQRSASNPGPMGGEELADARAAYFGTITHLDHQLGRLFGALMAERLWENTLVIYASDHGELLGDFGAFGKSSFLEPSWRVPLIVRPPTAWECEPGRRSPALVQLADLLPTLCDAAGADTPPDIDGRSLLPHVRQGTDTGLEYLHGQHEDAHVVTDARFKYLYFADDGSELAFDLVADPRETQPLAESHPEVARLRAWFHRHLAEEAHPHWDGQTPLNRKLAKPSLERARALATPGLPGISWGVNWARSIQHFH